VRGPLAAWRHAALLGLPAFVACSSTPERPECPPRAEQGAAPGWVDVALPGKRLTCYQSAWEDGRPVVLARADASASLLRRSVRVEPGQLGKVQFSWRIASLIPTADLTDADHSDSPVRLVFAFDGDHARLSMRNRMLFDLAEAVTGEAPPFATLMYVWDNHLAREMVIPSARTDRVRKIVLESGDRQCGRWLHYERDLVADYRRAFGEDPGALIGVALMTDADNTASRAAGSYGAVRLLDRDGVPL